MKGELRLCVCDTEYDAVENLFSLQCIAFEQYLAEYVTSIDILKNPQ